MRKAAAEPRTPCSRNPAQPGPRGNSQAFSCRSFDCPSPRAGSDSGPAAPGIPAAPGLPPHHRRQGPEAAGSCSYISALLNRHADGLHLVGGFFELFEQGDFFAPVAEVGVDLLDQLPAGLRGDETGCLTVKWRPTTWSPPYRFAPSGKSGFPGCPGGRTNPLTLRYSCLMRRSGADGHTACRGPWQPKEKREAFPGRRMDTTSLHQQSGIAP